jgi:hypothetical protein
MMYASSCSGPTIRTSPKNNEQSLIGFFVIFVVYPQEFEAGKKIDEYQLPQLR